jgi:hypothetical protein
LQQLAQQSDVSVGTMWKTTELWRIHPYKITVVPESKLVNYEKEGRFDVSGYVNSQNNRYWISENPHGLILLPFYNWKIGVWCVISTDRIIGPIFYEGTLDAQWYINEILDPFFH